MRIVWLIMVGYIAIVALAYWFQYRLLYYPEKITMASMKARAAAAGLAPWPRSDEEYLAWIGSAPVAAPAGTVIVFHGNAGCALDRAYYRSALEPLGFRVLLVEYPGYGARSGHHGETHFAENAVEVLRAAKADFGGPLYLWGESLGCGVAAKAASLSDTEIDGIALLTPWDTLPNVAQSHYWYLPARWLMKDRYDNIGNLRKYKGPVAVIKAGRDEIIPGRFTDSLYEAIACSKKLWTFENAGHNTWPTDPHLPWWGEVMAFLSRA